MTGLQPLCFRVWPYGEEDLEKNRHAYELPVRDYVNVNIDLNIHGVGGADSWGQEHWMNIQLMAIKLIIMVI